MTDFNSILAPYEPPSERIIVPNLQTPKIKRKLRKIRDLRRFGRKLRYAPRPNGDRKRMSFVCTRGNLLGILKPGQNTPRIGLLRKGIIPANAWVKGGYNPQQNPILAKLGHKRALKSNIERGHWYKKYPDKICPQWLLNEIKELENVQIVSNNNKNS